MNSANPANSGSEGAALSRRPTRRIRNRDHRCLAWVPLSGKRRGAAAAELALVLPLLVTLVLGCIDFGRFGYAHISLTNAVRVGAGVGSTHKVSSATLSSWRGEIRDAIREEFSGQTSMSPDQLTVPDPEIIVETTGLRRVRVRADYQFQMLVPWPLLPSEIALTRTVEMRVIR